jgi:two-component system, NarL family, sensor histidine kinase UhpB
LAPHADAASLKAVADSMTAQLDDAVAAVRRMSSDLHPLILDNLGLRAALDWLANDVAGRRGLVVELHVADDIAMAQAPAIAVYRLAEAVLAEVSRHVTGGVSLELLQRPRDLVLQVQWEPGHTRPATQPEALAELSDALKDQVHLLAGKLELDEPEPGMRRVSIFLPFAAEVAR